MRIFNEYMPVPAHYCGDAAADEGVRILAQNVADSIITTARSSGDDPVAWVTGNSYFPPLRACPDAETAWQARFPELGDSAWESYWDFLNEEIDRLLEKADVWMDAGPDGSLYVVDLRRFEYDEENGEASQTLSGEWRRKP